MGCNNCDSDEEGMNGWCEECQTRRVKRVRASIRADFWAASNDEDDEDDEDGEDEENDKSPTIDESQATLDSY